MVYFFIGSAYLIGFFGCGCCGACYGVFQTLRSYFFFTSEDDDEDEEDEEDEEEDEEDDDRFLLF